LTSTKMEAYGAWPTIAALAPAISGQARSPQSHSARRRRPTDRQRMIRKVLSVSYQER
jgi:hypothetical protein